MSKLKVAAVQFELRREESFAAFAAHFEAVMGACASEGAELVVLPELVTTGLLAAHPQGQLTRNEMGGAYREFLTTFTAEFADLVSSTARKANFALVGGSHYRRREDGAFVNTAFFSDPKGTIHLQDKLHLTPPEVAMGTTPGDEITAVRIGPATVAVQICADIEFPEVTRALALQGVNVVVCPSLTWNRRGANRVRTSSLARAVENQVFVAAAPLIGSSGIPVDGAMHCTGSALICCPMDRHFGKNDGVLSEAGQGSEQIAFAELDFDTLEASRAQPEPPGLKNIRPDLYARLPETITII